MINLPKTMKYRIQLTNNFHLDEYIPRHIYILYAKNDILRYLVWKIDKELVKADQRLRDTFGSIAINNWWDFKELNKEEFNKKNREGIIRNWSGLRTLECKYYSSNSQHSLLKASDKIPNQIALITIKKYIICNWRKIGCTAIENGVSWLHTDTRFIPNQKYLYEFDK